MRIDRTITSLLLLLLFSSIQLNAQTQTQPSPKEGANLSPWYVGITGGMPFGMSTFSSFGADKTRIGYNFGVSAGYQISPIFSTEISVATGRVNLGARDCCVTNYWLGADGLRYFAPLTEQPSYSYRDIYSSVALQQVGLHLNINLIPLINRSTNSRWSVLVSPAIYGVGSKATIKTSSGNETVLARDYRIGFGAGADVALGYAITESLGVRLGTGVNVLTGKNMDGMPKGVHSGNFLWNSNLAFTWRFGKCKSKTKSSALPKIVAEQPQQPEQPEQQSPKVESPKTATAPTVEVVTDTIQITLPSIYFAFDSDKINRSQRPAMNRIISAMQEYPQIEITVTGWSDPRGSKAVNSSISLRRAKAIGQWLESKGISALRMTYKGMGVDKTQSDYKEARRADVSINKEK